MRHGNKINHLGRTYSHRKALLSNLAISLILNKRITTTVAKARELRIFVEPLLTKSKPHNDTTHSRRVVFSYLQNKEAVKELFSTVGEKIAERPGGYTRIIKIGARPGDNAEMAMIELVDFNEVYGVKADTGKAKTRRSRRGSGKGAAPVAAAATEEVVAATPVVEASADEMEAPAETPVVEASSDETTPEAPAADAESSEEEKS